MFFKFDHGYFCALFPAVYCVERNLMKFYHHISDEVTNFISLKHLFFTDLLGVCNACIKDLALSEEHLQLPHRSFKYRSDLWKCHCIALL